MQPNEMKTIIDNYIQAYNAFDIDGMLMHMHEDIRFENVSSGEVDLTIEGTEELRIAAEEAKELFNSRTQTITSCTFSDHAADISIDFEATLATDLPDGPQAGDKLQLSGRSTFRFQDGRIISLTDQS